ncbi:MAG TPA: hypothetical protein VF797_18475 [Noviherbaspirillum sp.]
MKIKMLFLSFASLVLPSCSSVQTVGGAGMIMNYGSTMEGRSADIRTITFPSGKRMIYGLTVTGGRKPNWRHAVGTTEGMSGDTRGIPEWLDFEWREPSYPGLKMKDFPSDEAYSKAVSEKYSKLTTKTQRVFIKSRIPPEVVHEAIESRLHVQKGQGLPEKSLWIYFIWTDDGIKFRWDLYCTKPCVTKEGGDEVD